MYDIRYPSPKDIIIFLFFTGIFFLLTLHTARADGLPEQSAKNEYKIIVGDWQRTDGNYRIKVSDIMSDGRTTAAYFNPKPIHIETASTSTQNSLIRLFIKFQDKNYEGSTYELYYIAKNDALAGYYYQAFTGRTYEVVFLRKG